MSTSARKSYHHGDLRRALVTAARAMVDEVGPTAVTLRAVAARAEVSPAAPYRHFANKEALLAAVAAAGFAELAEEMTPPAGDPVAALRESGFAYLRFAVARPRLYRLMFGAVVVDRAGHADLAAAEQRLTAVLADTVEAARRAGGLGPLAPEDVMLTLHCVMHGLSSFVVDGQVPAEEAAAATRRIMKVVDTGLGFLH